MSQLLNTAKRHSIVAAYEFDEASGNLLDKIGSNNGTVGGTPVYGATDQLGGTEAVEFDGSTDYFTLGSNVFNGASAYTIEAIVSHEDFVANQVIFDERDGSNDGILFLVGTGPAIDYRHNSGQVASSVISEDTFYHLTITWDGATLRLYIDGSEVDTDSVATAISTTTTGVIGARDPFGLGLYYDGAMSWLAFYDEALSATDIQELYQAGRPKPSLTLHHDLSASAIDSNLTSYAGRVASNNFSAAEVAAIFAADSGSGADVWFSSDASGATPIDAKLLYWSDGDSVFAFDVAIASASSSTGATVYLQVGNKPSGYGTDPYRATVEAAVPLASNFDDLTTNGNDGDVFGSLTAGSITGPDGSVPATDFDGVDDYIAFAGLAATASTSDWTFSLWVDSENYASEFALRVVGDNSKAIRPNQSSSGGVQFTDGKHGITLSESGGDRSGSGWYHIAASYDGTDFRLYVDGAEGATDSAAPVAASYTNLTLSNLSDDFNGGLSGFRCDSEAISAAEINADYLLQGSSASTYWTVTDISSSDPLGDKSIELGASHVYVFDEASGKLLDRVGSNDGTASGTPTYRESDQRGLPSAIGFDGSTDYFTLASSNTNGASAYTVEALVKYTGDGLLTAVFYSDRDASDDGVLSYFTASTGGFRASHNATDLDSTTLATDGEWHHVVTTWDGSTFSMYVDGSLEDSAAVATSLSTTAAAVIGRDSGGLLPFPGDISHVAIYPRALTATEVGDLYTAGQEVSSGSFGLSYDLSWSLLNNLSTSLNSLPLSEV